MNGWQAGESSHAGLTTGRNASSFALLCSALLDGAWSLATLTDIAYMPASACVRALKNDWKHV